MTPVPKLMPVDLRDRELKTIVNVWPNGGPHHERAIRMALNTAWALACDAHSAQQEKLN